MTSERDRGSITGFVVVITVAVLACAALVIDGGRKVAAYVDAADHAENAARAGAQEVSVRGGTVELDEHLARHAAQRYLQAHDVSGEVRVEGVRVTVTVTTVKQSAMLRVVGISTLRASATRSAEPARQ